MRHPGQIEDLLRKGKDLFEVIEHRRGPEHHGRNVLLAEDRARFPGRLALIRQDPEIGVGIHSPLAQPHGGSKMPAFFLSTVGMRGSHEDGLIGQIGQGAGMGGVLVQHAAIGIHGGLQARPVVGHGGQLVRRLQRRTDVRRWGITPGCRPFRLP
jgi:hypothetical protein